MDSQSNHDTIKLYFFFSLDRLAQHLIFHKIGTDILKLSEPIFKRCSFNSIFYLLYRSKSDYAILSDYIGITTRDLVLVIDTSKSISNWLNYATIHPWLKLANTIKIELYNTQIQDNETNLTKSQEAFSSEQFIIDLDSACEINKLSTNTKRNISRASKIYKIIFMDINNGFITYKKLVLDSDKRRTQQGIGNVQHDFSQDIRCIKTGRGRLFFAGNEEIVSGIMVSTIADRAFYVMGGTSPIGMKNGASHYLIHTVAKLLAEKGYKSFTLGYANRQSLKDFKTGLGASGVPVENRWHYFRPSIRSRLITAVTGLIFKLRGTSSFFMKQRFIK